MIARALNVPPAVAPARANGGGSGVSCGECGLRGLCLSHGLDDLARDDLGPDVRRRPPLGRGEMLYAAGRPAHALYAIRSGSLKTCALDPDGDEFVQGFCLAGEVLGLESLSGHRHDHFAVALEPTLYCEIPAGALLGLIPRRPALQRELMQVVNGQLSENRRQSFIHSRGEARVRLASFLLELSRRRATRKLSPTCFRLGMGRRDIANYLGLTVETVSRAFSRFQREGLLESHGKQISLSDPRALAAVCGASAMPCDLD